MKKRKYPCCGQCKQLIRGKRLNKCRSRRESEVAWSNLMIFEHFLNYFLFLWSTALSCNENDGESMDRDSQYSSSQKTKRMRTSFKHHQLRTMKSYFAINHNPDAKDLKQLAQKTGLTKRVLQVSALTSPCFQLPGVREKQKPKEVKECNFFPIQISLLLSVKYMK